ncbi:MAG: hypothetical protein Q9165_001257 [Trypethelium subeluteriae]
MAKDKSDAKSTGSWQDGTWKPVMDQFGIWSNSRLASHAIKALSAEKDPITGSQTQSQLAKTATAMLKNGMALPPLPQTDFKTALDNLTKLHEFEKWPSEFAKLRENFEVWKKQGIDVRDQISSLHTLIFSETGQAALEFAKHYHALLVSAGVLTADEYLIRADGTNDRALNQIQGRGMYVLRNAEKMSSEGTAELSSRMREDMVIVAGYAHTEKKLSKDFKERFFLEFDLLRELSKNAVSIVMESLESWSKEHFKQTMSLEGGFKGPYARTFAARIAENEKKAKGTIEERLKIELKDVTDRQVLRLGMADARGAEADPFKISKEDLLGEEPDVSTYETGAWRELQSMVGLDDVKASMRSFINGVLLDFHREIDGYKPLRPGLCKLFLGPPGTGKTTVGKLFGKVLCGLGMLSSENFVFKNATDFIGSHIGHSEKQTKEIIRAAKGKVLMIDEAYMLDPYRNRSSLGADPFRQAVIDTIVGEVQNSPGEDLCVIMCGYQEPMERMLERANPGLARRFPLADAFIFHEYSLEQLAQVLDLKLQAEGLKMTNDARSVALDMLKLAKQQANFGNGGEIMNLLGRAMSRYRTRFGEMTPEERTGIVCFQTVDIDPKHRNSSDIEKAIEESLKDLDEITDSKTRFQSLARRAAALRKTGRDPTSSMPFHFVVKEGPGADPMKIANKIAWLYFSLNLLFTNDVVDVSAQDMTAGHLNRSMGVGGSDLISTERGMASLSPPEIIAKSLGKVLLIHDAHYLAQSGDDQAGVFVTDLRTELIDSATNPQFAGKVVIVLAGDERAMDRILQASPSLAGRFRTHLHIHGLSSEAHTSMLKSRLESQGISVTLTEEEESNIKDTFQVLSRSREWNSSEEVRLIADELVGDAVEIGAETNAHSLTGFEILDCLKRRFPGQLRHFPPHKQLPEAKVPLPGRIDQSERLVRTQTLTAAHAYGSIQPKDPTPDKFQYPKLPEGRYIRILSLLPPETQDLREDPHNAKNTNDTKSVTSSERRDDVIKCELEELRLGNLPDQRRPFDAVSYTWGTEDKTERIECNGKALWVTPNCSHALRDLRQPGRSRKLWIDAICIDQDSDTERDSQVSHMGDIYRAAMQVYIYLGAASPETNAALDSLQKLSCLRGSWGDERDVRQTIRWKLVKKYRGDIEAIFALEKVMKHEWWGRIWTFQEFILAARPVIVIGKVQFLWDDFYSLMTERFPETHQPKGLQVQKRLVSHKNAAGHVIIKDLFKDQLDEADQVYTSVHMFPLWLEILDAVLCRRAFQERLRNSPRLIFMSHFLLKARNRNAKDPKDKLYGLHGLFKACGYDLPEPDYSKSPPEIYKDVTYLVVRQSKSWWILSHLFNKRETSTLDLSSWVPDFNTPAIWHQRATMRFYNLNALEERLKGQEKKAVRKIDEYFRLDRLPDDSILTIAVFLWTVTESTSEMPSNSVLDVSFDQRFEQTEFEVLDEPIGDFLFTLARWLKSMEDFENSQAAGDIADESSKMGVTDTRNPQSRIVKAIAGAFFRSLLKLDLGTEAEKMNKEIESALLRILSSVRACISPDEKHVCHACQTPIPHNGDEAVDHLRQSVHRQDAPALDYMIHLLYICAVDHALFRTSATDRCPGHFGFCRNLPRPGDNIVLLPGLADPVIVRRHMDPDEKVPYYRVVGVTTGMMGPPVFCNSNMNDEEEPCFGTCTELGSEGSHEVQNLCLR